MKDEEIEQARYDVSIELNTEYATSQLQRLCNEIDDLQDENKKLKRENEIMRAYLRMILDIGYDYDGCRKAKSLMELIDELLELAQDALDVNDEKIHYTNLDKNYNILLEEISNKGGE